MLRKMPAIFALAAMIVSAGMSSAKAVGFNQASIIMQYWYRGSNFPMDYSMDGVNYTNGVGSFDFSAPNTVFVKIGSGSLKVSTDSNTMTFEYINNPGAWGPSQGSYLNGLYVENGPILSVAGASPITGVTLDPRSALGSSGFQQSYISWNSTDIALTWAGEQFSNGDKVILDVAFQDSMVTPLPATLPLFASGLAGIGLLGWRRKRRTDGLAA